MLLVLPVVTLIVVSFAGGFVDHPDVASASIDNYLRFIREPQSGEVFVSSLLMSGIAAVAALVWSFCVVSLLNVRTNKLKFIGHWRRLISLLVVLPWALPGTVVAVAVAEAYGQPSLLLGSFVLVGTFWILPVVYF